MAFLRMPKSRKTFDANYNNNNNILSGEIHTGSSTLGHWTPSKNRITRCREGKTFILVVIFCGVNRLLCGAWGVHTKNANVKRYSIFTPMSLYFPVSYKRIVVYYFYCSGGEREPLLLCSNNFHSMPILFF